MTNSRFSPSGRLTAALAICGVVMAGAVAEAQTGGGRWINFSMTNLSEHTADVVHSDPDGFHVEDTLAPGDTFRGQARSNEVWGWADPASGEVYKSARINAVVRRLNLTEADVHADEPEPAGFDLEIRNRTREELFVSREIPRMGMKRMTAFGTLGAWQHLDVPLEPGMKWVVEDNDGRIVMEGRGDRGVRSVSIYDRDIRPREASVTVYNHYSYTVSVLKRHDGHYDSVATVRPMHRVTLKGAPGTKFHLARASSGKIFRQVTLSGSDEIVRLKVIRGSRDDDDWDDDHDHDDDDDDGDFRRFRLKAGGILRVIGDVLD